MYDGMTVYRALVVSSSSSTGDVSVRIPSVLGAANTVTISKIGREEVSAGVWSVPEVGDQILVAVEDDRFSNVFIVEANPSTIDAALLTGTVNSARLTGAYTGITGLGTIAGTLTAGSFSGSGASLTSIPNSATTATNANTASAIVARDGSGNFTAGTITAALSGNATTATTLGTARNINGVSFDGSANITVPAAAGTLTGTTLASGVTASSLTSVGTITSGTWSGSFGAVSGANLTSLNATSLSSGTVASARIAGAYTGITGLGTITNTPRFDTPAGNNITMTGGGAMEVFQPNAGTDAYVNFHVSGDFAAEFGLAGDINDFAYGGWSFGANKYRVMSAYNTSSGLQAFSPYFTACYITGGLGSSFTESNALLRVKSSAANTGISVSSVSASNVADYFMAFYDDANGVNAIGSIYSNASTSATIYATTSDYRLKRDDVPLTGSIDRIMQLRPITFKWVMYEDSPTEEGFFAHEVQAVVPSAVSGTRDDEDDDGNMVVQQMELSRLVPVLVGAVQELTARVAALETPL